jgi:hypothetical protein
MQEKQIRLIVTLHPKGAKMARFRPSQNVFHYPRDGRDDEEARLQRSWCGTVGFKTEEAPSNAECAKGWGSSGDDSDGSDVCSGGEADCVPL